MSSCTRFGVAAAIETSRKVGDLLGIAALLIVSTWVAQSGLDGQVLGAYFGAALIGIMAAKAVNVHRKRAHGHTGGTRCV